MFVAFELTKKFETHYRGSLAQVMEQLMLKSEDSRLKGEITMVLAPGVSEDAIMQQIVKGTGFDTRRDAVQKVNVIEIAKHLNTSVEMGDEEFRELLKGILPEMPSYHIDALVKIAKKNERK